MEKQELIDRINEEDLSIQFSNLEEKEKIVEFLKGEGFTYEMGEELEEGFIEYYDDNEISDFEGANYDVMTFQEFLEVIEPK